MTDTEQKIADLSQSLLKVAASDYVKIQEISDEIEKLKIKQDDYTMRWLELSE